MATCSWLATTMDEQMLLKNVHSANVALNDLPVRSGSEVAEELGGRWLLRYVAADQVHEPDGSRLGQPTHVTPTPYPSPELDHWLELPIPDVDRPYVIRLDPSQIARIAGPQYVGAGMGIQYVLLDGYDSEAVVGPGWAREVR